MKGRRNGATGTRNDGVEVREDCVGGGEWNKLVKVLRLLMIVCGDIPRKLTVLRANNN